MLLEAFLSPHQKCPHHGGAVRSSFFIAITYYSPREHGTRTAVSFSSQINEVAKSNMRQSIFCTPRCQLLKVLHAYWLVSHHIAAKMCLMNIWQNMIFWFRSQFELFVLGLCLGFHFHQKWRQNILIWPIESTLKEPVFWAPEKWFIFDSINL